MNLPRVPSGKQRLFYKSSVRIKGDSKIFNVNFSNYYQSCKRRIGKESTINGVLLNGFLLFACEGKLCVLTFFFV